MDNRLGEVLHGSDVGFNVQGVEVTTQAVEEGLAREGFFLEGDIWVSGGPSRDFGCGSISFVAKASQTLNSQSILTIDHKLLLITIHRKCLNSESHQSNFSLISSVRNETLIPVGDSGLEWLEHFDHFLGMQDHEWAELGNVRGFGQRRKEVDEGEAGRISREGYVIKQLILQNSSSISEVYL